MAPDFTLSFKASMTYCDEGNGSESVTLIVSIASKEGRSVSSGENALVTSMLAMVVLVINLSVPFAEKRLYAGFFKHAS
jgi:hypothetical protein